MYSMSRSHLTICNSDISQIYKFNLEIDTKRLFLSTLNIYLRFKKNANIIIKISNYFYIPYSI